MPTGNAVQLSRRAAAKTRDAVVALAHQSRDLRGQRLRSPGAGPDGFYIRITSATAIPSTTNRWSYGWSEVQLYKTGVFQDVPAGRTSADDGNGVAVPAYNELEQGNTGDGIEGSGINVDDLPDGVTLQSVPTNGKVVRWARFRVNCDGNRELIFEYPNTINSPCTSGGDL